MIRLMRLWRSLMGRSLGSSLLYSFSRLGLLVSFVFADEG
jgi:hypothetical protein